jgi:GNAT superfamily N-acetyltransferase
MPLTIRHGTPADAEALAAIAAQTFRDAFGADNRPEDLALHLSSAYGPRQQARELADPAMRTLLAEDERGLVAYSQLRRGPAPGCVTGVAPLEVMRFYVTKAWHGKGVAQALMQRVDFEARQLGADTLWLGVWERNPRGIAFYRKAGFVDVGSQVFVVGSDAQTDRVMVKPVAASPG